MSSRLHQLPSSSSHGRIELTSSSDGQLASNDSAAGRRHRGTTTGLSRTDMDEAYRRLGQRLSMRACGDGPMPVQPEVKALDVTPGSAFSPPVVGPSSFSTSATAPSSQSSDESLTKNEGGGSEVSYDRTHKVAKKNFTDHGSHRQSKSPAKGSVLKKLVFFARDTYQTLLETSPPSTTKGGSKKRISPCTVDNSALLSPQRHALSQLDLDGGASSRSAASKGLLHAVLEGGSGEKQNAPPREQQSPLRRPGKCLTTPSTPMSNDGRDNMEGNLVVHENDIIRIPPRDVHSSPLSSNENELISPRSRASTNMLELRVVKLLGQGTFAQVFKCEDLETGELVALKVVKNKPAYTRQAAVEIDVFRALAEPSLEQGKRGNDDHTGKDSSTYTSHMVKLLCYFMHQSHLCLVFELLGLNLYEVLKSRQFRGLPLPVVRTLMKQAMEGVKDLSQKSIVHCDLKPENILLIHGDDEIDDAAAKQALKSAGAASNHTTADQSHKIKLIDFGSACFEGHTAHSYIQSRFYRSPEVLIGLPYDSAIDMWSLGCVAAELFLGLPILPGVHEHDQLGRIIEMIGILPDKMLDEGNKSTKYFTKHFPNSTSSETTTTSRVTPSPGASGSPQPPRPVWRIKTRQEYIDSLSPEELHKKGGLTKLGKQPTNRYFKRKKLADIIMLHGQCGSSDEKQSIGLFAHFLLGILDPDPWKRWTAYQASMHPFITGSKLHRRRTVNGVDLKTAAGKQKQISGDEVSREIEIHWTPPWDPSICRRRLLHVQKSREKQQALRTSRGCATLQPRDSRTQAGVCSQDGIRDEPPSPGINSTSHVTAMADAMSLSQPLQPQLANVHTPQNDKVSPPTSVGAPALTHGAHHRGHSQGHPGVLPHAYAASLGTAVGAPNRADSAGLLNTVPPSPYYTATSLTDFHHPGVVDQQLHSAMMGMSPLMHGMSGGFGQLSSGQQMMLPHGAQSFSGLNYEGWHHMPAEGDLGYALQRPNVPVPSMSGDVSNDIGMYPQFAAVPAGAYSPHRLPCRSRSITGRVVNSCSYTNPNPSSYTNPGSVGRSTVRRKTHFAGFSSTPQSSYMHNSYMTSPTSIREDGADYNLGDPDNASSAYGTRTTGAAPTTSLLAQQLEEHSASGTSQKHAGALDPSIQPHSGADGSSSHPQNYAGHAVYGHNVPGPLSLHPSGYYCISAEGNPIVMSAPPTNMAHLPTYGSYGSVQDHQGMQAPIPYTGSAPIHPVPPVGAPPPYLTQPSFEEMEYLQPNGMPLPSGIPQIPPPQRPPAQYVPEHARQFTT